ncbi:MAG: hypothetical protein N3A72_12030 [bacterium]|nr:hypothetical protein [bacterium]
MLIKYVILIGILALLYTPSSGKELNVLKFGAKGDGKTDNTLAFQKALDTAGKESGGRTVFVPKGNYLFKGHLVIPDNVTLQGVWQIPTAWSQFKGTTLLPTENEGNPNGEPFITLKTNSLIKGITIFYPNQSPTYPPKAYPWTIASGGADNCAIIDCLLVNPYQAVDFGTRVAGRHYIRNLYAQPLYKGLYIDQCYDIGRLENIHFWPFWQYDNGNSPLDKFIAEKAEAFIIGRTDWEYMSNCFSIFYNIGYHFIKTNAGTPNILATQCGADICQNAVQVDDCQAHAGISFHNSQFYGRIVVNESNTGPVRFTGCGFFGSTIAQQNEPSHAELAGSGHISFDNCHFVTIDPKNKAKLDILAKSGSLTISDSLFLDYNRDYIRLEPEVRTAIVSANTFKGKGQIINDSQGNVQIVNNVYSIPKEEANAIIIDNLDSPPQFVLEGDWKLGVGGSDYLGAVHWAVSGKGECKAFWRPQIPNDGNYAVYLWYGADPNNDHATNAKYSIVYSAGQETKHVDLRKEYGRWHLFGCYPFKQGNQGFVTVSNDANGNVLADAVKFVPITEKR